MVDKVKWSKTAKKDTKLRLDLVDPCIIEAVAKVQKFGMDKGYEQDSWKEVETIQGCLTSIFRHLLEILKGNYTDPESNLPHIFHICARSMYIIWLKENK